jgi:3-oxoacyl-[acyl-carrier-protein] synthase-3
MSLPLRIVGVGRYIPEQIITNAELEARCGLSAGWIAARTGVLERRRANGETSSRMAASAARDALADAKWDLSAIDLIVNASGTPEQTIPDMAPLVQQELGLGESGIPCISFHATCLSFLVALDWLSCAFATGRYRNALVVSADISSSALNYSEPESAVLFGDAAAAAVVQNPAPGDTGAVHAARFETFGIGAHLTELRGGGSRLHPHNPETRPEDNLFHMDGTAVYRMARLRVDGFLERLRPGLSQGLGDIKLVVPHQASLLALRALRRNNIPDEKVVITLDRFGNCVATSLPLTLYEAVKTNRLSRGDHFLLCGTGAGLSLGGLVMEY